MNEVARANLVETAPNEAGEGLPFLTRWSRRKLGQETMPPVDPAAAIEPMSQLVAETAAAVEPPEPIDPRTGKRMSELTDEDMPDVESLDENSDLAAFMGGKVSRALRMKALGKVFHTAKFNQVCLCAEYADDYTNFTPLGDIVPHDLQQAIVREAGRLCERLAEKGVQITPEEAQTRVAAEYRGERLPDIETPAVPTSAPHDDPTGQPLPRLADQYPGRTMPPIDQEAT